MVCAQHAWLLYVLLYVPHMGLYSSRIDTLGVLYNTTQRRYNTVKLTVLYRVSCVKSRPPLRKVVVWLSDGVDFDTRCVVSSLVYQQPAAAVYRWYVVYIDWNVQRLEIPVNSRLVYHWPTKILASAHNMDLTQHNSTQPRQ